MFLQFAVMTLTASGYTLPSWISKRCERVLGSFTFGLQLDMTPEGYQVWGRGDPSQNATLQREYAEYRHCVEHLRTLDRGQEKSYTFAVGKHHGNLLLGPGPTSGFMLMPAMDFVVSAFLKTQGTYDIAERDILERLLNNGDVVIEVGSNIGVYSVMMAEAVGSTGFLYAFEPFRKVFQILTANVALNGLGNVQTFQMGVGRRTESVEIRVPSLMDYTNLGAARVFLQQDTDVANVPYEPVKERVQVKRLDDLEWSTHIDFVKIDAEGMEEDVVVGAEMLLERDHPLVYVENQPYFFEGDMTFIHRMENLGYACDEIDPLQVHHLLLCVHKDHKRGHLH